MQFLQVPSLQTKYHSCFICNDYMLMCYIWTINESVVFLLWWISADCKQTVWPGSVYSVLSLTLLQLLQLLHAGSEISCRDCFFPELRPIFRDILLHVHTYHVEGIQLVQQYRICLQWFEPTLGGKHKEWEYTRLWAKMGNEAKEKKTHQRCPNKMHPIWSPRQYNTVGHCALWSW